MSPQKSDMAMPCRLPLATALCGGRKGGMASSKWHCPLPPPAPCAGGFHPPTRRGPNGQALPVRHVQAVSEDRKADMSGPVSAAGGGERLEEGRLRKRLGQSVQPQ